jgi:hypothetical protein
MRVGKGGVAVARCAALHALARCRIMLHAHANAAAAAELSAAVAEVGCIFSFLSPEAMRKGASPPQGCYAEYPQMRIDIGIDLGSKRSLKLCGRLCIKVGAYLLLLGFLHAGASGAQDVRSYTTQAPFDDVKFELSNAIISRGFNIDYTGDIGRMLERTGPDVGSSKPLYAKAEFMMFCSAKLSRAMIEANLANIGFCPYVVFIYTAAGKPEESVVGYRRPTPNAAAPALAEIDALLDGIVREAVK